MKIQALAKINLTLRVLGKRPDGYHELESVMQMLTLADTLTIESEEAGIAFTCSTPGLAHAENLVVRAARAMLARSEIPRGARIHLDKRIPTQAGLGGGSSDAAVTLIALNELWEIRLPGDELSAMAARLGSDLPFFLNGPAAVVRGRGEAVTPLAHETVCHLVVAKPDFGLPTGQVYAALRAPPLAAEAGPGLEPETQLMAAALQAGDVEAIARRLANDLEAPAMALAPSLGRLRERMLGAGCLGVRLCGSGSAIFGVCADAEAAASAARALLEDCPWTWAGPWQPFA